MSEINWGLAVNRTNPFAEAINGFQQGTEMRRQNERDNLFAQRQEFEIAEATRKRAAEEAAAARKAKVGGYVAQGDYAGARTAAEGDFDMLESIGKLDESQRKQAAERAGVMVAYIDSMQGKSEQEIMAQIQQDAPALMELGYTQEQLSAFRPTPGVLAKMRAEALGLKGVLEQRDREADNKRADATLTETKRSNNVREGIARGQLGVAQGGLAVRQAAFNERKKAGGFGTPGVGGSAISDDEVEID